MITVEQLISKTREYLGTPFLHQGRQKGLGVDCGGLLCEVCRELEIPYTDAIRTYPRTPVIPDGLLTCIESSTVEIPDHVIDFTGCIHVFYISSRGVSQHTGIQTDDGRMIHSDGGRNMGVIEVTMGQLWRKRIMKSRGFAGVSYPWLQLS